MLYVARYKKQFQACITLAKLNVLDFVKCVQE